MTRVAVLGGGPGGALAAERLASGGLEVVLYDEKLAWEKPCGGGLSYKAYRDYPFLADNPHPKRTVDEIALHSPGLAPVTLRLEQPLVIYSRLELNRMLLDRAARAGARLEQTRVLELAREGAGWRLRTQHGTARADFAVVATGARNPFRECGAGLSAADVMSAMGYYVSGNQAHAEICFLPNTEGYIWVFPRAGHLSIGICGKKVPARELRARLETFMAERGVPTAGAAFYSHLLPSLEWQSWRKLQAGGEGWMAVGDAAGLVDPITGEGIYYALRSGDLAARAILEHGTAGAAARYRLALRRDFAADLQFGALLARRFYTGRFLRGGVTARVVQFAGYSPQFRRLMQHLFEGRQPYRGLKGRLYRELAGTLLEVATGVAARRFGGRSRAVETA